MYHETLFTRTKAERALDHGMDFIGPFFLSALFASVTAAFFCYLVLLRTDKFYLVDWMCTCRRETPAKVLERYTIVVLNLSVIMFYTWSFR